MPANKQEKWTGQYLGNFDGKCFGFVHDENGNQVARIDGATEAQCIARIKRFIAMPSLAEALRRAARSLDCDRQGVRCLSIKDRECDCNPCLAARSAQSALREAGEEKSKQESGAEPPLFNDRAETGKINL